MKIGFALPVSGSWSTPENVAHVATRAEALGYHELWTFQRLLSAVDDSWGEVYRQVVDPMVTLGYVAALTGRIAAACHAEGVIVLTCGTFGNVIRFLPPLAIDDALLHDGLDVVAAALGSA